MPRTPKPQRLRQNTERRDFGIVPMEVVAAQAPPPPPRPAWLAVTRQAWLEYWASGLAQTAVPATDMPAIIRLFDLRDERERAARAVRRERVVKGSMGQLRPHPLYAVIATADAEVRQLEDRFGLSPVARLRLGVTFGDAARSLADLNRDLDNDADGTPATDLRLTLPTGPAAHPRPRRRAVDGAVPRPRAG